MSVQEVTMHRVLCDRCGESPADDEYYAWVEADQALDHAADCEWLITDEGQWCYNCVTWDEDADCQVPLPPLVANG